MNTGSENLIKVLSIGQLPTEVGGSYTSGIARVVFELSKHHIDGVQQYLYATNIPENKAIELCEYPNQYMGFIISPFSILIQMLKHPISTIKQWYHYKHYGMNNPLHMEFFKFNFQRAIECIKPDLIHMHGVGIDALYFANRKTNVPVLLTLHGLMWDGDDADYKMKRYYSKNLSLVDYYTGLNMEVRRKMSRFNLPDDKITLIPNGCDTSKFYFSEDKRMEYRKKFNVDEDCVVFMTVGLVVDRKGQFDTLKILETLEIKYQYWIIGNGPDFEPIKQYVAEHNLENKVRLLGYVCETELYQYHSASDVYAHASTMEGQSLAEIEAYSSGLRVMVRKEIACTVVGDAYNDHTNYFVIDYSAINYNELKEWINKGHPDRCSRKGMDWSNVQQKYVSLYKNIIHSN